MKKNIILILLMLIFVNLYCQINNNYINIELRKPTPIGDNFINKGLGKGYTGYMDLGIDYNFFSINKFAIGLQFNTSVLENSSDVGLLIFSPKLKSDLNFKINDKLILLSQIGIGYSRFRFRIPNFNIDNTGHVDSDYVIEHGNGISYKGSIKLLRNRENKINWFILLSYEFTKLTMVETNPSETAYNQNIQILYPGIGMSIKIK